MNTLVALALSLTTVAAPQDPVARVVERPPVDVRTPHYAGTRAPLRVTPLVPLPLGAIEPRGWLHAQLELQASGFHGHLTEISRFLEKDGNAWLTPDGMGTHGWEEPVYWLKGFGACAYTLRDEAMIAEAKIWIEAILESQKEDGWFGPDGDRGGAATRLRGRDDLWPNMIALFCLQDWFEFAGDERVLRLMERYFRFLEKVPEDRFLLGYWPKMRGGDLLFSVYWLHARTDDGDWLLDLAAKVHRRTAPWQDGVANWHNVNMAQGFGEPTTFWLQSGDRRHLEASYANFDEMRRTYGQVPGGMFGGDENCRPGYTGPRQAVETCGMVEMTLSLQTLTWITGDPLWADRCEDVAFNSLPAATTADLKALRYLTAPNMVVSDASSKAPGLQNGGPMLLMDPHRHRCCQHDFGHGWPYLGKHAWFATNDRGLAAVLYTDSVVRAKVAGGEEVTIEQRTRYPFGDRIEFTVRTPEPVRFPLYLRVPGWCEQSRIEVDDSVHIGTTSGRYVRIERLWQDGTTFVARFPMQIAVRRWTDNHGTVSVDRGPLTYSLQIGEQYRRAGGTDAWPAWEIWPTTPWNYGLELPEGDPAAAFEIVERPWPDDDRPFTHEGTPIELRANARRIPEWQLDHLNLCAEVQDGPVRSDQPVESITLIPMGAARLRITAFPVIGHGPDARVWAAPPEPLYRATSSHCWGGDTDIAMADGLVPESSGDHSIPRHTFWDHRGTTEWIQAEFDAPREVSKTAVYWFDDTGRGACRVPDAWRLFARRYGVWVAVDGASGFGVERDRFNDVTFSPIVTDALRIEIDLREEHSGGVLEWRID